jgi:hypothetical protein
MPEVATLAEVTGVVAAAIGTRREPAPHRLQRSAVREPTTGISTVSSAARVLFQRTHVIHTPPVWHFAESDQQSGLQSRASASAASRTQGHRLHPGALAEVRAPEGIGGGDDAGNVYAGWTAKMPWGDM